MRSIINLAAAISGKVSKPNPTFISRIKFTLLSLGLVICFIAFMPELARRSAPFGRYAELEIALSSCGMHLRGYDFCEEKEQDSFIQKKCMCTNENALATASHCYVAAYPEQIANFIDMCNRNYLAGLTRAKFDSAVSLYDLKARSIIADLLSDLVSSTKILHHPLKLNDSVIYVYKDMYDQFLGNYNRSIVYGFYLVEFWLVVFGIVAIGNWAKFLFPHFCKKFTGPSSNWIRKNITLPALFGRYKTNEKPFMKFLDLLVPTRAETLILLVFTALVCCLCVYNIRYVEGDPFFTRTEAYLRYYAVRTGILGSYLLPFSVLFAGRNNILQWITKWEYATFVTFHRWISRLMVLLIIIHSSNYAVMLKGKTRVKFTKQFIICGYLGTFCGIATIIQGLLVLRRKWYEAFLLLHIVLAAGYMLGAWFHVKDLYFLWFYYCSVYLWLSDRVLRIHRLCSFGFPVAVVKLYEDNTLKVAVRKPKGFEAEGGGHCFLHFLRWNCFWQSHPFTYTVVDNSIIFYVKVKEGVTKLLGEYLENHPERTAHIRVAVEGSYGGATPAFRYDTGVFVAGGNGIPGIYAEAIHAAEALPPNSDRKIKLIWVVREYHSLLWFYDELISLKETPIEVEMYVTKPAPRISLTEGKGDKLALLHNTYTHSLYLSTSTIGDPVKQLKSELKHIEFKEGRPNIQSIVSTSVKESLGSVAFVTCGHPIMVDDLRHEVVQIIGKDHKRVDFFEQLQVWA